MATSNEFNERVEALLRKALLDEYPHVKISTLNKVCKDGAGSVAYIYKKESRAECAGVRPLKFFDLPRELRDIVYEYAIKPSDGLPITLNECPLATGCSEDHEIEATFNISRRFEEGYVHGEQPAVTRASRQLREEALPLFYQTNNFAVCLDRDARLRYGYRWDSFDAWVNGVKNVPGVQLLSKWLISIGEKNVSNLVKVTVHYTEEEQKKTFLDTNLIPAKSVDFVYIEDADSDRYGLSREAQDQLRAISGQPGGGAATS